MKPGRPRAPLGLLLLPASHQSAAGGGQGKTPSPNCCSPPLPGAPPHPHQPSEQLLLSPESSPLAGVIKNDLLIMQAAD